jgi:hypothetical protein
MALNKQIKEFRINVNSTNYDFDVQNMDIRYTAEYFQDRPFDKALSGAYRQRLAGFRQNIVIDNTASVEASTWRNFVNDVYIHFVTNNEESAVLTPDKSVTGTTVDVVINDRLAYAITYSDTIATFVPSVSFVSKDRITSIPSGFQAP